MIIEILERRRLLSVSVEQGYPGYYEIRGDEGDNDISVSVSMADATFTFNGVTYGGVSHVSVFGNGGGDSLSVLSTGGQGTISAWVKRGTGPDTPLSNLVSG